MTASILVTPVLAGLAVSIGVPILLAYVYGVVPISLCRCTEQRSHDSCLSFFNSIPFIIRDVVMHCRVWHSSDFFFEHPNIFVCKGIRTNIWMNFPFLLKINCWSSNEALIPTLKEIPKEIDTLPLPPSYKLLAQWHICLHNTHITYYTLWLYELWRKNPTYKLLTQWHICLHVLHIILYGFMGFGEKVEGPALKIRADSQYSNSTGHWRSDYLNKFIGGWEGTNSSGRSGKESKTSVTEGGLWRGWVKWRKGNQYEMNFCATFVNTLSWTNIQIISYAIF